MFRDKRKLCSLDFHSFFLFAILIVLISQNIRNSKSRPDKVPQTCRQRSDCPIRYACISSMYTESGSNCCICNHFLLFHGDNCEKSRIIVPTCFSLLAVWSLCTSISSLHCVIMKWKNAQRNKKLNASITTLLFVFFSSTCLCLLCHSNIFRSLLVGEQAFLESTFHSLTNFYAGLFEVLALLNIAMLWIEMGSLKKVVKLNNIKKTKQIVSLMAYMYIFLSTGTYILLDSMTIFYGISGIYMIAIAFFFLKGSLMLSKKYLLPVQPLPSHKGSHSLSKKYLQSVQASPFSKKNRSSFWQSPRSQRIFVSNPTKLSSIYLSNQTFNSSALSSQLERREKMRKKLLGLIQMSKTISILSLVVAVISVIGILSMKNPSTGALALVSNVTGISVLLLKSNVIQYYLCQGQENMFCICCEKYRSVQAKALREQKLKYERKPSRAHSWSVQTKQTKALRKKKLKYERQPSCAHSVNLVDRTVTKENKLVMERADQNLTFHDTM